MRNAWVAAWLLALGFAVASCGGDDDAGPRLLFGTEAGIVERNLEAGTTRVLIAAGERETLSDPAISPDGERIVYTSAMAPRPVDGVLDVSSQVRIASSDGTGPTALYERTMPGETASAPRWLDETTVMFLLRKYKDPNNQLAGSNYSLAQIDTETQLLTTVVDGPFGFDISPDRMRIAYVTVESVEEQPLFIANADGTGAQRRLDATSGLGGFGSVAFTSDGGSVLLLAHVEEGKEMRARATFVTLKTRAHGAPVDLYAVPIEPGDPQLIAGLQLEGGDIVAGAEGLVYAVAGRLLQVDTTAGTSIELEGAGPFGIPFYDE
jgi:Tol biopolymer transport system component